MPRKNVKKAVEVVEVQPVGNVEEVEVTSDISTIPENKESEEVHDILENQPISKTKPKRVLSELQLANLAKAREAAAIKKKELKELANKAKALPKKEIELKAAKYDEIEAEKQKIIKPVQVAATPKTTKKTVKAAPIETHTEDIVQMSSMQQIQMKLRQDQQKQLMQALLPMC